jgi:hypothetical protein
LFAELRRSPPERAATRPRSQPCRRLRDARHERSSGPRPPPRPPDQVAERPAPSRPEGPVQAEPGRGPGVPTAAERPNVDQTAAIRTDPRPHRTRFGGESPGERGEVVASAGPRTPAAFDRRLGRTRPGRRDPRSTDRPNTGASTGLAAQPPGSGSRPAPTGSGLEGMGVRGGLQAVVDQIARLRDDVHRVGEG